MWTAPKESDDKSSHSKVPSHLVPLLCAQSKRAKIFGPFLSPYLNSPEGHFVRITTRIFVCFVFAVLCGMVSAEERTPGRHLEPQTAPSEAAASAHQETSAAQVPSEHASKNEPHIGHMKAAKILFLGNSITAVPQRTEPVWWGLSASTPAKDYAHLLAGALEAKTGGVLTMLPTTAPTVNSDGRVDQCESNVINIADVFERGYATYEASKISRQLAWKADIVILQFGENIPSETYKADIFRQRLGKLVADLKESSNPHIFVTGYILGANAAVDEIKQKLCEDDPAHRVFVDLSNLGKDPSNIGEYGHPNDKGMALISETLLKALLAHAAESTK